MERLIEFLKSKKIDYEENSPSADYCTFKGGGLIKLLILPENNYQLIEILKFLNGHFPFKIFGNLSNTLIADEGYDGIIILTKRAEAMFNIEERFICTGGTNINKLICYAKKRGYGGLERLFTIPSTIGGGIIQNCGCYGCEISDFLEKIEVFDLKTNETKFIYKEEAEFDYRTSNIKDAVILNAFFDFYIKDEEEIEKTMKEVALLRKQSQPSEPSVGSVFKRSGKYSSGYYIEKVGLKGHKKNNCMISDKHANFIINLGGGKVDDYIYLKNLAKNKVYEEFGVVLEEEIIILNNLKKY